ncbi:RNA helicase [Orbilia ellipsospora]|uniref:ATP-dependent RNA helicase n=1 Tax=Orbilia ellipsospora TaxID=2528407 RepID=A0AAV9XP10_9PEZI
MRGTSILIQRSRQRNNVPRLLPTRALSPSATVIPSICTSCLSILRLAQSQLPGSHALPIAGYVAAFHSTTVSLASSRSTPKENFRKAVGRNKVLREMIQKPSRMVLSERVGQSPRDRNSSRDRNGNPRWDEKSVDTGGGMNRKTFRLRSDDKQQYSKETERRKRDLRESSTHPSPSRFEQRPSVRERPPAFGSRLEHSSTLRRSMKLSLDALQAERKQAADELYSKAEARSVVRQQSEGRPRFGAEPYVIPIRPERPPRDVLQAERRKAAQELESRYSGRGRGAAAESDKMFTRPPIRRFAHMKHIASLDHVSSKAREITHAAEEQFGYFETFDLLPQTLEALYKDGLKDLENVTPTPVQSLVIPSLLDKEPAPSLLPLPKNFHKPKRGEARTVNEYQPSQNFQTYLIAAETGSGKTLAYIIPLMDTLKRRELAKKEEEKAKEAEKEEILNSKTWMFDIEAPPVTQDTTVGRPFAVIIVPTTELAFQVANLIKKLAYTIKLRTEMITREVSGKAIRERLFRGQTTDIVVGTPFMIDRITEANPEMLHRTSHIIVDEADSLFDRSFSSLTGPIINRAINLEKLILCSATIPKSLDAYVSKTYPECKRLVTANLHAIPRRVQLQVIEVEKDPYRGNKLLACAHVLGNISKDQTEPGYKKRIVVFVNERETTAAVTSFLQEKGFDAVEINRDSDSRSILESFTGEKEAVDEGKEDGKGAMKILVTTDLASRGVDTKTVKNVILYDVPYTSIDFIHRLGRTGRMGRRGRAWVLVDKDSNHDYVKEVKKTMFLGQALI